MQSFTVEFCFYSALIQTVICNIKEMFCFMSILLSSWTPMQILWPSLRPTFSFPNSMPKFSSYFFPRIYTPNIVSFLLSFLPPPPPPSYPWPPPPSPIYLSSLLLFMPDLHSAHFCGSEEESGHIVDLYKLNPTFRTICPYS
jgi:hypothetical protein